MYLSLGLHKGPLSNRRSLQPSKENIYPFKTRNFLHFSIFVGHILPGFRSGFRMRIRIHWPDWIRIQSGPGSETLAITLQYIMYGTGSTRCTDVQYLNISLILVDLTLVGAGWVTPAASGSVTSGTRRAPAATTLGSASSHPPLQPSSHSLFSSFSFTGKVHTDISNVG